MATQIKEIIINDNDTVTFKMERTSQWRVVRRWQFTVRKGHLNFKLAQAKITVPWSQVN